MATKKVFLTIEYQNEQDYEAAAFKVVKLCSHMGVEIKNLRELKSGRKLPHEKHFHYKTKEQHKIVRYSNILFFQKELRKVKIYTTKGVDEFYSNLGELMEELDMTGFIIPHRSFIVNREKMIRAEKDAIFIEGSEEMIPISRRHRKYVAEAFAQLIPQGNGQGRVHSLPGQLSIRV